MDIRRRGNVDRGNAELRVFLQYVAKTEIINERDTQRHCLNVATVEVGVEARDTICTRPIMYWFNSLV